MKSSFLLALLVAPLLAAGVRAQDGQPEARPPRPEPAVEELRRDPKALEAFRALAKTVYRARDDGLEKVEFDVTFSAYSFGNPDLRKSFGPYKATWTKEEQSLVDESGEVPDGVAPLLDRVFGDFVGFETEGILDGHHVTLTEDGTIRIEPPDHMPGSVRRTEFARDQSGRLLTQKLFDKDHVERMSRRYAYVVEDGITLIRAMVNTGAIDNDITFTHQTVDGYVFPKTVSTQTVADVRTVTYSNVVVTPKKAKPGVPAATDGEKDDAPASQDEAAKTPKGKEAPAPKPTETPVPKPTDAPAPKRDGVAPAEKDEPRRETTPPVR